MPGAVHRIYLDHAATTPLDQRVLAVMLPLLSGTWGNPSSSYAEGRAARAALDAARRTVARLLNARPAEIVFTAGGSESDNLAILGIARAADARHIVTTQIEHHAVLHAVHALEREGRRVTYLPVDHEGFVDPALLEEAILPETGLVSIMTANNEVGTLQPIGELVGRAKRRNPRARFHTDAVQAAGEQLLDVEQLGVDALSLAAHKFYGPKGAGILYLRSGTPLAPLIRGGSQERDRRAGTEAVAGATGLAEALRLACEEREQRSGHMRYLRDRLLHDLPRLIAGAHVTGPLDGDRRLASIASFTLEGVDAEALLMQLDLAGFAASSGSACTTGSLEPSHVLTAMGIDADRARGSLRLSVGTENTVDELERLLAALPSLVARVRAFAGERSELTAPS
jgi:cysteine desulfurase